MRSLRKLPGSRRLQFEQVDRPALPLTLPSSPYVLAEWKTVRVHIVCGFPPCGFPLKVYLCIDVRGGEGHMTQPSANRVDVDAVLQQVRRPCGSKMTFLDPVGTTDPAR